MIKLPTKVKYDKREKAAQEKELEQDEKAGLGVLDEPQRQLLEQRAN